MPRKVLKASRAFLPVKPRPSSDFPIPIVMKDNVAHNLTPGESIDIQIKETHSLENPTDKPLKILEVQKGDILDENDIVRLSDMYGRV